MKRILELIDVEKEVGISKGEAKRDMSNPKYDVAYLDARIAELEAERAPKVAAQPIVPAKRRVLAVLAAKMLAGTIFQTA